MSPVELRVRLSNGEILRLEVEPDAWGRTFKRALRSNTPIEIEDPEGRVLGINPQQVLYWEHAGTAQNALV